MSPDCRTVKGHCFDLDADDLIVMQLREHPIQHATLGPAIHAYVDRVPITKPLEQPELFAALLSNVENRIQNRTIGQANVSMLSWQTVLDQVVLRVGDFHSRIS